MTGPKPLSKPRILIVGWDKLQHFKDRDPIWIKLYRALRHNRRWRRLTGDAAKLYIDLLLLAADGEPFGSINLDGEDLAWEVRLDPGDLFLLLAELSVSGLIAGSGYHDDVKLITDGNHGDDAPLALTRSREVEGEEEVERETTNGHSPGTKGWSDQILHVDLKELEIFCKDFGIPHEEMNMSLKRLSSTQLLPLP